MRKQRCSIKQFLLDAAPFKLKQLPYWSVYWSKKKQKFKANFFVANKKKKFLISREIRNFLVETTGLEPVTSCV